MIFRFSVKLFLISIMIVSCNQDLPGELPLNSIEGLCIPGTYNATYDQAEDIINDNGNGVWDQGEEFIDTNADGIWNDAEPFIDYDDNGNGEWDEGENFDDVRVFPPATIKSWDDSRILISLDGYNEFYCSDIKKEWAKNLFIERNKNLNSGPDTAYYSAIQGNYSDGYFVLDEVVPDLYYQYYLHTSNADGNLSTIFIAKEEGGTSVLEHSFPPIENIEWERTGDKEFEIAWNYRYQDFFNNMDVESIDFNVVKYEKKIGEEAYSSTALFKVFPNNLGSSFLFLDTLQTLGDSVYYSISAQGLKYESESKQSDRFTMTAPSPSLIWVQPHTSRSIELNWEFSPEEVDLIEEVTLTRVSPQPSAQLLLSNAADQVSFLDEIGDGTEDLSGTTIQYQLEWCGVSCYDTTFSATTFPVHHMVYISGTQSWGDDNVSVDPYYIDVYEVNTILYETPTDNPLNKWDALPKSSISWHETSNFCESRDTVFPDDFLLSFNIDRTEGFRLPTVYEWEVAAMCSYQDGNIDCSNTCKYPNPICNNDDISCLSANFFDVTQEFDSPPCPEPSSVTKIGYYENPAPPRQDAKTSTGLYDTSGNVSEWTDGESDLCIAKGGNYNDTDYSVQSTSIQEFSCNTESPSIGFRTAVSANQFKICIKGQCSD